MDKEENNIIDSTLPKANEEQEEPLDYKQEDPFANLTEKLQPGDIYYMKPIKALNTYPCYIDNPTKIEKTLKSFVQYTMNGTDVNEPLTRRYSDFFALYEKLIQRWPGVYIPNIPPKKVTGNLSTKTIKVRMRLLNRFLLELSEIDYLYNSEEAKMFRSNITDIATTLEKLPTLSYMEILERMKVAFPWNNENYDIILGKTKIAEFEDFLKRTLKNITTFKASVASAVEKREDEKKKYIAMIQNFTNYEKLNMMVYAESNENALIFFNPNCGVLSEKVLRLNQQLGNSFSYLENWLNEEALDIEALLLAIKQITDMFTAKEKLKQKIDNLETDIKKMEEGNVSFLKSLFKKKEDLVQTSQKDKELTEQKVKSLDEIIGLACANMENKIDSFKEEKAKNYYKYLKTFAILQREDNKIVRELWLDVKKALKEIAPNLEENNIQNDFSSAKISTISKAEFFGNQYDENKGDYVNEEEKEGKTNEESVEKTDDLKNEE